MEQREFEHIAPELRGRSLAVARSMGLDADEAEDVAQDVLLKLWTLRSEIGEGSNVMALASVASRNLSIDRRRRCRTVALPASPLPDDRHTLPDARLEEADNTEWLQRKLRSLPSTEYHVLHLRQVERRDDSEIAAILGIAPGSVPTLLSRARRRLLEAMKERMR